MPAFAEELADFVRSRVSLYTDFAVAAVAQNPHQRGGYARADLEQMVMGFVQILVDDLHGVQSEARHFYCETVIPGIIGQGDAVSTMNRTVTGWMIYLVDDAARHLPESIRAEALPWLSSALAAWNADMVDAGIRASDALRHASSTQ